MADLLATIGSSFKALTKRSVPFSQFGQYSSEGIAFVDDGRNWGPLAGNMYGGSPGAGMDYKTYAGEPLLNRVVATCVNVIAQALADAPPFLEERRGNEWEKVDTHPITELLNRPNDQYGMAHLWSATAGSEVTRGEAFWRLEFDRTGTPAEIWWENGANIRAIGTEREFVSNYELRVGGKSFLLEPKQIIHFRHALNPNNPRAGWTPLNSGYRQIAGDNAAATYHSAILRNSGVLSLLISAKEAQSTGGQLGVGQIEEFATKLKAKLFGEGAGGIAATSIPIDMQKMSYSPDEMALDKLISYYEASICALIGVDPMVCGLGSGTQQKTYANMAEALNDFWERRIIPTKNRHASELATQLLPLFDLAPANFRISWDYSKVAPLQENEDELHARIRENYKAGVMDLMDARTILNLKTTPEMEGQYAQGGVADEEEEEEEDAVETKSLTDEEIAAFEAQGDAALKALAFAVKYDPRQPRDDDGRWGTGGSGSSDFHPSSGDNHISASAIAKMSVKDAKAALKEFKAKKKELSEKMKDADRARPNYRQPGGGWSDDVTESFALNETISRLENHIMVDPETNRLRERKSIEAEEVDMTDTAEISVN